MDLTSGIMRHATETGRMLALLAVLFLAVNPHAVHAGSGENSGHGHFGSLCLMLDTEQPASNHDGGTLKSHGDCVHHFDPLVQTPTEQPARDASVEMLQPHFTAVRHRVYPFDPPPPRIRA